MEATSTITQGQAEQAKKPRGGRAKNDKKGENVTEDRKNVTETVTEPKQPITPPADETKQTDAPPPEPKDTPPPEPPEPKDEPPKPKEVYIYIGPPLPGGALPTNKVFQGSIEDIESLLADVLEKYPKIKHLIVPSYNLSASKVKVRAANNILGKYYSELRAEFAKGVAVNGV